MQYLLNQKEYDEYQRLLVRSNSKYIHPTESVPLTYEELKKKQYKDYFEYCTSETGLDLYYPKDRDKIGDGTVDGTVMLEELNTDDNLYILKKIRENIGIYGVIPIGIDNLGCIIYVILRSDDVGFDRDAHEDFNVCLVPYEGLK